MSYKEEKSKNFSAYCRDGKMTFVKKWIDNPNVDINWNFHSPLRNAVRFKHVDIINLLLDNPKLETNYGVGRTRELKGEWNHIKMVFNPFTEAVKLAYNGDYEMLDLLVKSGKFEIKRVEYLNMLVEMENEKLTEYFLLLDGFQDYMLSRDSSYSALLLPQEVTDIFIF